MMIRMKREFPGSQNSIFPVFDTLLLLDRNVDLLTPLATQLTYEGLIDEIYGIQNSESCREGAGSCVLGQVCASLNGCGCGSNSAEINVGLVQSQAGAHQDPLWLFLPGRRSQVQSVVTEGVYFGCWLGAGTVTQHGACEWKCWCVPSASILAESLATLEGTGTACEMPFSECSPALQGVRKLQRGIYEL